jgi:glycosyltransferase involved in cell wall biosynthesis
MMVSFIIPAHNEEALIAGTIEAIRAAAESLELPDAEIIVVDDASTDRTAKLARMQGAEVISVNKRQIAAVRNAGAKHARGEVLFFVDADTIVSAHAVAAAIEALRCGAVGGGCAVRFEGVVPLYGRVLLPTLLALLRWTRIAAGCFLFCRRDVFDAVGGFDERYYASEEIHLSHALRKRGRFVILREHVTTSGRKLRQFTAWEILGTFMREALHGPWRAYRNRDRLGFWYDARRETSDRNHG